MGMCYVVLLAFPKWTSAADFAVLQAENWPCLEHNVNIVMGEVQSNEGIAISLYEPDEQD